jgi:hypothetical protein
MDAYNQIRDSMPDIGAYEVGGIPNAPPVLEYISSQSIFEGQTLSLVVRASDPDDNTISLRVQGLPDFGTFIDNGNGTGFLSFSDASDFGTYEITVVASDGVVADTQTFTLSVQEIIESGSVLAGHWTFEEDASDLSGMGNHGTLANASYTPDPAPYPEEATNTHALATSGSGLQFSAPDSDSLRITGDLTLAAYIKPSAGTAGNIVSKSSNDGYRLVINNDFQPRLLLGIPDSGPHTVRSLVANVTLIPDEWQHIAVTVKFDNGTATVKFFHNNALVSTHTTGLDGIESGTGLFTVGTNDTGNEPYSGIIDDLRIYNGALSDSEIKFLYGDFHVDPQQYWGGFPVIDQFINTGDWFGWLYLFPDTNWLYSFSLETYFYSPSPEAMQGSWVYLLR